MEDCWRAGVRSLPGKISRGDAEMRRMFAKFLKPCVLHVERRTKRRELCIPKRRSRKPPLDVARPRATLPEQEKTLSQECPLEQPARGCISRIHSNPEGITSFFYF